MTTNEIATIEKNNSLAVSHYGDDTGAGFENATPGDLSLPFIAILQANSPQVGEQNPEGAAAGLMLNTITQELMKEIIVVSVHRETSFVQWVPREKGGGFVAVHAPNSPTVQAAIQQNRGSRYGKLKVGSDDLVETNYEYVLLLEPDGETVKGWAVIGFSSTKIKPGRDWYTARMTLKGKPPIWASRARITAIFQKNDKGSFYNFQIKPWGGSYLENLIPSSHPLYGEARSFRQMVLGGMARASYETQNAVGEQQDESVF